MSYIHRESVVSILDTIHRTRRPRLLLRAARFGLGEYDRQRDLKRVLRLPAAPRVSPATVRTLMEMEREFEEQRTRPPQAAGDTWRAARHVEVLICLIAESRLLVEEVPSPLALDPSAPARSEARQAPCAGPAPAAAIASR